MSALPEAAPALASGADDGLLPRPRRGLRSWFAAWPWPLFVILGVQAALSVRLLRLNAAFVDEATYLYAGHQELDHWVHGWPIPSYPTYFSGAPTIYPPLAALVDHFGGLTGARLLSLVFMLAVTAALWASAKRLFGRTAATAACALFASLGSTQALGAFATFDGMALMFLAIGAYCAIRAADASDDAHWWPLCATFLALANATKYTTALWDPFVIAIVMILTRPRYGGNAMVRRAAGIAAFTSALLALGLAVGGTFYVTGITSTTVAWSGRCGTGSAGSSYSRWPA